MSQVLLIPGLNLLRVKISGLAVTDPGTQYTYTAQTSLPSPSYQWFVGGLAVSGATSSTYQRTVDWLDHNLAVRCVVTSSGKTYFSNRIVLQVGTAPVLTTWDRYVSTMGNDANDGLTPSTAWATLAPLATFMDDDARSGQTIRVRIEAGTYETNYNVSRTYTTPATLILDFAPGVTIQRGAQAQESCLQALGNLRLRVVCRATGNDRLLVTGFLTGTGNAYGFHNTADLRCWGVRADNNLDGFTGHQTATGWLVDSDIRNSTKGGIIHASVIGPTVIARTTIVGRIGALSNTLTSVQGNRFVDCNFEPVRVDEPMPSHQVIYDRCRIGGTNPAFSFFFQDWATNTTVNTFNDCFLRATGDPSGEVNLTRCYGLLSSRTRGVTTNPRSTWDRCVFVGVPASITGAIRNSLLFSFNNAGLSPITLRNCIITGYTQAAIGENFSAADITNWNANCLIENCCFFGNGTNINASIIGTASNTVTSNPLLGPANTVTQTDYAVATNSPCVGAGVGGTNIGWLVADLPIPGV